METNQRTNILLGLIAVILTGVALKLLQPVLLMFLTAVVLAYLMDPIMLLLRRKLRLPVSVSIAITGLLFLAVLTAIGWTMAINLVRFGEDFPGRWTQLLNLIQDATAALQNLAGPDFTIDLIGDLRTISIPSVVVTTARSALTLTTSFLLVFFFALLTLSAKYYLPRQLRRMFPRGRHSRVPLILRDIDASLRKYIAIKTMISASVGLGTWGILRLFGLDFAIVWGLLTFLLNYIPSIGSIVATTMPFLFSFTQFADSTPYLIFVFVSSLQILTGNVLEPKIMGDNMNLSLLVVFLSLLFWGWLWGAPGVLLAVPMTTSIKIVLSSVPSTAGLAVLLERPRR